MDESSEEAALKKKLQNFLAELQRFGSLCGFKHFSCYIRGREELLVSINNEQQSLGSFPTSHTASTSRKQSLFSPTDSFSSSKLPYDKGSLVLSLNTQTGLSGMRKEGIGLPPASPSETETMQSADATLFLIAGYARYSCPYVWVRSNHQRLFRMSMSGEADGDKDSPLKLKSITRWKNEDIHVFDILVELVKLCAYPAPRNPFEVDLDFFRGLADGYQLLASAAMITYLEKILMLAPESKPYTGKIMEDLQQVSKLHFKALTNLVHSNTLPALADANTQRRTQTEQPNLPPQTNCMYPPRPAMPVGQSPRGPVPYNQTMRGCFPGEFSRKPSPSLF